MGSFGRAVVKLVCGWSSAEDHRTKPGHYRRRYNAMFPKNRLTGCIDPGSHLVVSKRAVKIAVHIVLTRPHHFDRLADSFRKPDGIHHIIAKAPTESTA